MNLDIRTHRLEVKGLKRFLVNRNQMKVVLAIFTWDKQAVINDKEGRSIIKGLIQQKDTIFVSIYKPNIEAFKYIKQTLRLAEIAIQ